MMTRTVFGSLLLALALFGSAPATLLAQDQTETASDPDAKCVRCHSRGLKKKLEDGETLSLKVDVEAFGSSVHRVIGCTGCHRDVAKGKHPSRQPIESRRAYSIERNQTCRQCHRAKSDAYEDSVHARMVREGSEDAPLCSDCHSAHEVQSSATYDPKNGQPCSACHAGIFEAYEESVHGTARREGNRIRGSHVTAPICADCHKEHDVSAVAATDYLVDTCLDCHEVAQLAHEQWLPNASMHMNSVGCAACHAPEAPLRVDLQLFDREADAPVNSSPRYAPFRERLADLDSDGTLGAMDLWKLVRLTEREGMSTDITLRGRLEVANGMDAHRLADSTQATRSCESCHESRSESFRNVTVSITRPDGRRERFEADSEVLSSVFSVDTISGFYAPGGTRIKLLDYLLILAILGGLAVPVIHITLGKIVRGRSNKSGRQ
jgi:hypothetical protein